MVWRDKSVLMPLERSILETAIMLAFRGAADFHGYAIAREMRDREEAKRLTAHGTLYRALDRMEKAGYLISRQEDADTAASENRPRRRLYSVTAAGQQAFDLSAQPAIADAVGVQKQGLAPR